ncbi:hypothetical protein EYC08_15550 [Tabrizicola sp. WMC-M-20]|nr:hypothetical protein EYC08_15550 [Tabrizicola sp. WMC-M-20]
MILTEAARALTPGDQSNMTFSSQPTSLARSVARMQRALSRVSDGLVITAGPLPPLESVQPLRRGVPRSGGASWNAAF